MSESSSQFEKRKQDHIRIALDPRSQAEGLSGLDKVQLTHEALPNMNFEEVDSSTSFFSTKLSAPFFISSMTAGHEQAPEINARLARLSAEKQILMGVGSQRRELADSEARNEWKEVRKQAPRALLMGNLGIAQIIRTPADQVQALVESLEAVGLFIHLNPLQECLQPEGTPEFRGGYEAIEKLTKKLSIPVIVKEVGCGFSQDTLKRLYSLGIHAVDVSGLGGTHWGRVEGYRSSEEELLFQVAKTFENWGLSTVQSLLNAKEISEKIPVWASGGVRDGLQTAKLLAMGADLVGIAQPWLKAALENEKAVAELYEKLLLEVKIAMFCTGVQNVGDFKTKRVWKWHEH
ncbi:type 2 isopentenyl-diphosphate Delta-isomerase [Bdellovibrio sp. HCB337]|uniref:type 2 isopentenyl-diphosphate Delta-isomerase n=1 Tax=Bdellovibrio sp. HCB337 TaxID=3394358 RepID=UPI0039A65E48